MQFDDKIIASDAEKADLLRELVEESVGEYQIPGAAFDNYHVKRGLRDLDGKGVLTGLTEISEVCAYTYEDGVRIPQEGELFYRGYQVSE